MGKKGPLLNTRGKRSFFSGKRNGTAEHGLVHRDHKRGPRATPRGIHSLDMSMCTGITDAGLAHLAGIHALRMSGCNAATIAAARARILPPAVIVA